MLCNYGPSYYIFKYYNFILRVMQCTINDTKTLFSINPIRARSGERGRFLRDVSYWFIASFWIVLLNRHFLTFINNYLYGIHLSKNSNFFMRPVFCFRFFNLFDFSVRNIMKITWHYLTIIITAINNVVFCLNT